MGWRVRINGGGYRECGLREVAKSSLVVARFVVAGYSQCDKY